MLSFKFKVTNLQIIRISRRMISFKKIEIIEANYYQVLGVNYDSDYETIKKKYYELAKKYHPDLNPSKEADEKFKKIKKAYEVLGDPNLRIAYDLENNLTDSNESDSRRESDIKYESRYGKRIMRGPRRIKNFYWDKWSEFKTPKWSNMKTGQDFRAEYMHRSSEENLDESQNKAQMRIKIFNYRLIIYCLVIMSIDLFLLYDNYWLYNNYKNFKKAFFS
jgi:DnaJ-class molecular chaperone